MSVDKSGRTHLLITLRQCSFGVGTDLVQIFAPQLDAVLVDLPRPKGSLSTDAKRGDVAAMAELMAEGACLFNMVSTMLNKAFARLGPKDRPLLRSDQGWQYQMDKYRERLDTPGVTQNMSRKGNCLDNAAMESFFGTLKSEFFHLNEFLNLEELEAGLGGYIRYYNEDRLWLKLNGVSLIEYRQRFTENLTLTV